MRRSSRALVLHPSAKINLTLEVGPSRADGFHEVRTVLQSIAITDTLTIEPCRGPFAMTSTDAAAPADPTNLIWRAAAALWRSIGRAGEPRDVRVRLVKRIPIAAGLGGGSADAAAALVGLNAAWRARAPLTTLRSLAADLGADVPFFFTGGAALGVGRGDEVYPLENVRPMTLVIVQPPVGVSAAEAYRWLDADRAAGRAAMRPQGLDVGWPAGPLGARNDLEDPVARRRPEVPDALEALRGAGASVAAMSGSGSAVFGVFPRAAAGQRAVERLERAGWRVRLTRTLTRREACRRIGL